MSGGQQGEAKRVTRGIEEATRAQERRRPSLGKKRIRRMMERMRRVGMGGEREGVRAVKVGRGGGWG